MIIQDTAVSDLDAIQVLVSDVAEQAILPLLNKQGQQSFQNHVIPDLRTVLEGDNFASIKAVSGGRLLGFAALRDGHYLTHLFVSMDAQGQGLGRKLLDELLAQTSANDITLRSSVNAVSFYRHLGFVETGEEGEFNGIRFVPMKLVRSGEGFGK